MKPCEDQMRSRECRPRPAIARARRSGGGRDGGGRLPTRASTRPPRTAAPVARKNARRIDFVPRAQGLAGKSANLRSVSGTRAPIRRQVGKRPVGLARIGPGAGEPFAELAQRAGVVVVPLLLLEERIVIGVRIEVDADEEVRDARARRRRSRGLPAAGCASCSGALLARVDIEGQRARELGRRPASPAGS